MKSDSDVFKKLLDQLVDMINTEGSNITERLIAFCDDWLTFDDLTFVYQIHIEKLKSAISQGAVKNLESMKTKVICSGLLFIKKQHPLTILNDYLHQTGDLDQMWNQLHGHEFYTLKSLVDGQVVDSYNQFFNLSLIVDKLNQKKQRKRQRLGTTA